MNLIGTALAIACLLAVASVAAAAPTADLFVAPNGSDAWSGKLDKPNAAKTDGPFATLARAQAAARELHRRDPQRKQPVVVLVRRGTYYLSQPLRFIPYDSNTTYEAYPGEKPVISGGVQLTGWQRDAQGRWQLHLPDVEQGKWSFSQLFVDGQRRYRPRLPKEGYYNIRASIPPAAGAAPDQFRFAGDELRADWRNLDDVEVLCFHAWTMDRMRIKSVDPTKHIVTFTAPTLGNNWFFDYHRGGRFLVENVKEALDDPGEWYLDRKTGVLTYIPLPGEDPEKTVAIAPRLERLIEIAGESRLGAWVDSLQLRGLTFAHTNWVTPTDGYRCGQSEWVLPGAIRAEGARSCVVDGCRVTHIGTYAIELARGCKDNRIENCELVDLAAGGIKLGDTAMWPDPADVAEHNIVRNCLIAQGGRMHAAGMGVWIGHSPYNLIEHNDIYDFYQTGISVGWSWGYGPSLAHDNTIQYNHIYQIGQGVTADMGGIYTLGVSPGTVLRYNRIHDVECVDYGGRGIYFDEGTSDMLAENNVVYRTDTGAFMHHYGRDDRVINSIFALARGGQIDRLREEDHTSFTFEHNLVYWKPEEGALLAENWSNEHYVMDNNLYWNGGKQPIDFGGVTLDQWRARGHDVHSIIGDPLFVDPENGDFRLKPDSPALKIGFKPFDMSAIGRLTPGQPLPAAPRAFPPKSAPRPLPIEEGFEELSVGDRAPDATVMEENDQATIRVTDETAASGKHSLKFIDLPGQKVNWDPHMFYSPGFGEGVLEGSFDLRVEAGTQFYHEWRTYPAGGNYVVGPSIWTYPDGSVRVGDRKLFDIPFSQWVRFDIVCGVGDQATGKWTLTVTLSNQKEPLRFPDLPCSPAFRRLDWYGFTANGVEAAAFYLDNIDLKPR